MFAHSLTIANFKRIRRTIVPLDKITVVVGGNNSGKSCVLQAPHFAVNLLQASVAEGDQTIPAQNLRYLPTGDVLDVPHGERLTTETPPVRITFGLSSSQEDEDRWNYYVELKRGEGLNVLISSSEDEISETELSDSLNPYTIYVPGLAGIPLREEYRSDALIANAIARGDANLYLRNVLLRIYRDEEKLARLNFYLQKILDSAEMVVTFDVASDSHIRTWIRQNARDTPLDAMGTGILQYLQIVAYVVEYNPNLLLLDEPDAHLHPNNQRVIANLLGDFASEGRIQVVLATHSRTLLDAFRSIDGASFVWMENGEVQAESEQEHLSMLMELGALDGGERFYSSNCSAVFLTEDTNLDYIVPLLKANGIDPEQTLIHSYRSSSRLEAALELANFIKSVKPAVRIIIHRDRDFMSDGIVRKLKDYLKYDEKGIDLFITEGSDIEHYFTRTGHIAKCFEIDEAEAEKIVGTAIEECKVDLTVRYSNKVDDQKWLYNKLGETPVKDKAVLKVGPQTRDFAVGKILVGKIIQIAQNSNIRNPKSLLLSPESTLVDEDLTAIAEKVPELNAQDSENG